MLNTDDMKYFLNIHGQPIIPEGNECDHADLARRVLPDALVATLDYAGLYTEMFRRGHVRVVEERDCLLGEAEDGRGHHVPFDELPVAQRDYLSTKAEGRRFIFNSKKFAGTRAQDG